MKTEVKICGITRLEDALLAASLGVRAVGFNFYPGSPRFISAHAAREIGEALPAGVWRTGVFVSLPQEEVLKTAKEAGLDTLQFHGDEDARYLEAFLEWRVIKAVRARPGTSSEHCKELLAAAHLLLIDAFHPSMPGGTGIEIEASILKRLAEDGVLKHALLAGGITPENAAEKIARYRPWGIDTAGGVESAPGKKDAAKMRALLEAASKL